MEFGFFMNEFEYGIGVVFVYDIVS